MLVQIEQVIISDEEELKRMDINVDRKKRKRNEEDLKEEPPLLMMGTGFDSAERIKNTEM